VFVQAMKSGNHDDIQDAEWTASRELVGDYSRSRAVQGFTPAETAIFIFSMKEPVFALLREHSNGDARQLAEQSWAVTKIQDKLGLFTTEVYQQSRDDIIKRQSRELLELSTRLCNCGITSSRSRSSARWIASAPRP
jgi:rsbT co-antagonist protein RsbR